MKVIPLYIYSYSFKFHCSPEMWAGVLFFLFCVGFVFYVFEHINIWIQKNHEAPKRSNSNLNLVDSINIEMDSTPFFSSKYIFKRVSMQIFDIRFEMNQFDNTKFFILIDRDE